MSHDPTTKRNGNSEEKFSKLLVHFPGIHTVSQFKSLVGEKEKKKGRKGISSLNGLKYLSLSNSAERHRIKAAAP
ncbi:hypothetical protein CEXT_37071 [Caerostris extrusa]|uniref:Uncharacterized protein n=1 Tax=Caerostris extrusa TaxID=172846 RepID=A0AAV4P8P4_CAEEX|nr:hypothetical protein CEXT_37071 [Caerostris extrusa]